MNITPARSARAQFDKQAAHYDTQWSTWSEETLDWMLHAVPLLPKFRVLDVATGTGFTALAFAPHVHSVVGVDVSPGMLAEAHQRAEADGITNVTWTESPAEALPFPDATFCLVTCRIAPHHFLDLGKFLSETARVLKPGGHLVLVDTTVPNDSPEAADWQNAVEVLRDPSHVRNYTPTEWQTQAEAAGLTVSEITTANGGITIPLSDWLFKAGCTPTQADGVRQMFADAPESAKQAFQITEQPDGETIFTWQRVALHAMKPKPEG